MTEAEACERAEAFAASLGRELADYDSPRVEFEDGEWWVFFQGKSGQPGDHFSVVVDDERGDARLVEGR